MAKSENDSMYPTYMLAIEWLLSAIFFVASTGVFYTDRHRKNPLLYGLAGVLAIGGTLSLVSGWSPSTLLFAKAPEPPQNVMVDKGSAGEADNQDPGVGDLAGNAASTPSAPDASKGQDKSSGWTVPLSANDRMQVDINLNSARSTEINASIVETIITFTVTSKRDFGIFLMKESNGDLYGWIIERDDQKCWNARVLSGTVPAFETSYEARQARDSLFRISESNPVTFKISVLCNNDGAGVMGYTSLTLFFDEVSGDGEPFYNQLVFRRKPGSPVWITYPQENGAENKL